MSLRDTLPPIPDAYRGVDKGVPKGRWGWSAHESERTSSNRRLSHPRLAVHSDTVESLAGRFRRHAAFGMAITGHAV